MHYLEHSTILINVCLQEVSTHLAADRIYPLNTSIRTVYYGSFYPWSCVTCTEESPCSTTVCAHLKSLLISIIKMVPKLKSLIVVIPKELSKFHIPTLSEAIGSLGWSCNSSSGSMLIRQLTEAQLLTGSKTAESGDFYIHWTGCHLSRLHLDSWLGLHPIHWTENKLSQLHLNWVSPELNQLNYLNIDN